MKKIFYQLTFIFFLFFQSFYLFFLRLPQIFTVEGATLLNASDTLSNSRLSYRAGVATGAANGSVVTIDSSGNADNNTNHLFPNDNVCFAGPNLDGCYQQTNYTVASIINTTTFNISPPLASTPLGVNDYVIASQSAIHSIQFTLINTIPANGNILITIPAIDITGQTNDCFPDTNSTIASNGFDLCGLGTTNIAISSSGCNNNWTVAAVTAGDATNDHTIRIDRNTNSCAAGSTITVTVGDTNRRLINPAPITSSHAQGVADIYTINVRTRDGGNNTLDQANIRTAVIEGVLVSANIEETLSLTIAGESAGIAACGQTTDVTTYPYAVPWGTIANFGAFQEASQLITVSTNAVSGYTVRIDENDQMGRNGNVCTGANAGEAQNCIRDTTCNTSCSESTSDDWTSTTSYGFGYSLQNVSGSDAIFLYNESSRTFSARQIPDLEAGETAQTIMSRNTPAASSQVRVCYRLNISTTQPAGYYFNKVRFTASATF